MPWRVRDAAYLLLLGFGVLALGVAGAQGVYRLQEGPQAVPSQPPPILTLLAIDLFYLAMLAGVWLLVVQRYAASWSTLGLRMPRRQALLFVLILSGVVALALVALVAGLVRLLDALGVRGAVVVQDGLPPPTDPLFVMAVIGSVVLTPVVEEVFYRGVLYQALRKHMGISMAATGSALVFAVLHPSLAMTPEFLLLGIALAVAFERTGSLYPSILMHAAYNGAILLVALHVIT